MICPNYIIPLFSQLSTSTTTKTSLKHIVVQSFFVLALLPGTMRKHETLNNSVFTLPNFLSGGDSCSGSILHLYSNNNSNHHPHRLHHHHTTFFSILFLHFSQLRFLLFLTLIVFTYSIHYFSLFCRLLISISSRHQDIILNFVSRKREFLSNPVNLDLIR